MYVCVCISLSVSLWDGRALWWRPSTLELVPFWVPGSVNLRNLWALAGITSTSAMMLASTATAGAMSMLRTSSTPCRLAGSFQCVFSYRKKRSLWTSCKKQTFKSHQIIRYHQFVVNPYGMCGPSIEATDGGYGDDDPKWSLFQSDLYPLRIKFLGHAFHKGFFSLCASWHRGYSLVILTKKPPVGSQVG